MTDSVGSPAANRPLFFLIDTPAPTLRPRDGYLPRAVQKNGRKEKPCKDNEKWTLKT